MMSEAKAYGHLFDVDNDAALREQFTSGQGVVELQTGMTDAMLLLAIKYAIFVSAGKPFLVTQTGHDRRDPRMAVEPVSGKE